MEPERPSGLSVLEPVGEAIDKVRQILFRPFDLGKWFIIGFCAWLTQLCQGGLHFNFRSGFGRENTELFRVAKEFVIANLVWIIPTAIGVILVMTAMAVVLCWLSSRGRFMFLHCVALNKAEVKVPWINFRKAGNNLFVFRVIAGLILFAIFAVSTAVIIVFGILLSRNGLSDAVVSVPMIVGLIFFAIIMLPAVIATVVFYKFTFDFVVPIMYLRNVSCVQGWREFLGVLSSRKGAFTLYILFQIVISMTTGIIVVSLMILGFCLCCCGFFILCIPYINVVALLPLLVFKRAYSLCYFRQLGPEYDVFAGKGCPDSPSISAQPY